MLIVGDVIEDRGDELVVKDLRQRHRNGKPFRWRFSKLTKASFARMAGDVDGHAAVGHQFPTDQALQEFYRSAFLYGYWVEQFVRGEDIG